MSKKEIIEFARKRGFYASYSGKERKFYFKSNGLKININQLINSK